MLVTEYLYFLIEGENVIKQSQKKTFLIDNQQEKCFHITFLLMFDSE